MPADGALRTRGRATLRVAGVIAVLCVGFWLVLGLMGRQMVSDSGFGVWSGAWTRNTSQWIADPYTLSHLLHGVFFYRLLFPWRARLTLENRFLIAAGLEACWEVLENSPIIIDRYRAATASLDYYGDSILNSTCDLAAAMAGFWIAWKLGWKWTLALIVTIELASLWLVRDNLTLNILMLFHPLEGIKQWQLAQ